MKKAFIGFLLLGSLSMGCAHVDIEQDRETLQQESLERTGHPIVWEQTPKDRLQTQNMVADLLQGGLTREEAIQVSLLHNPRLQATFQMLGIARADVIQAGLFTNPSLATLISFPTKGANGVGIDLDLLFRVSDLWNVPLRRGVAEIEAYQTTQLVVQEILHTAARARDAFDELLLQQAMYRFMSDNVALFRSTVEELNVRFHAGLVNDLDIYLARNVLYEGQVDLARIQSNLLTARARLLETLGLDPLVPQSIEIVGNLEKIPLRTLTPEQGWEFARNRRIDLQLNRLQISQTRRLLTLQKLVCLAMWESVGITRKIWTVSAVLDLFWSCKFRSSTRTKAASPGLNFNCARLSRI